MVPWSFKQTTKEDLVEVQIGEGNITIDLPSHLSREQEENDTTVVFIPTFRGASRFTVQYLHHNMDASINGLGVERVEAISKEKRLKLHQAGDKYYFIYIEQTEEEGDKEDIHFWVIGFDNAIIFASCCILQEDKRTQQARDLLNITEKAITSIRYSRVISYKADGSGPINTRALTNMEVNELDNWRQAIYDLAKATPQHHLFLGTEADLTTIQDLIGSALTDISDEYILEGFGIVFGDILGKKLDLQWITAIDDFGKSPALQYCDSGIVIYPRDLIIKRIKRGEEVDIVYIYNNLIEMVRKMIDSGEFEKPENS